MNNQEKEFSFLYDFYGELVQFDASKGFPKSFKKTRNGITVYYNTFISDEQWDKIFEECLERVKRA